MHNHWMTLEIQIDQQFNNPLTDASHLQTLPEETFNRCRIPQRNQTIIKNNMYTLYMYLESFHSPFLLIDPRVLTQIFVLTAGPTEQQNHRDFLFVHNENIICLLVIRIIETGTGKFYVIFEVV